MKTAKDYLKAKNRLVKAERELVSIEEQIEGAAQRCIEIEGQLEKLSEDRSEYRISAALDGTVSQQEKKKIEEFDRSIEQKKEELERATALKTGLQRKRAELMDRARAARDNLKTEKCKALSAAFDKAAESYDSIIDQLLSTATELSVYAKVYANAVQNAGVPVKIAAFLEHPISHRKIHEKKSKSDGTAPWVQRPIFLVGRLSQEERDTIVSKALGSE